MPGQQRFRLNAPHVVAEEVESANADDEAIVVNLTTGTYYSIRGDAILLWKAIAGGSTAEQIVAALVQSSGVDPDRAVAVVGGFRESLVTEGLIVEREDAPEPAAELDFSAAGAGLLDPSFETFSDMEDLILMDPVHQVDERGWPHISTTS